MKSISALDLFYLYVNNECLIIDIRKKLDYAKKHIPKSFNIPLPVLIKQCVLYLNKDFTYYIICKSGNQSKTACLALEKKGYNVINIFDGFSAWKGPTESDRMFNC